MTAGFGFGFGFGIEIGIGIGIGTEWPQQREDRSRPRHLGGTGVAQKFEEVSYLIDSVTFVDGALAVLDRAVVECRSAPLWALPQSTLVDSLDHVHALIEQMTAIELELIREVDGRAIAAEQGATSTVAWLRDRHRISPQAASRQVKLAAALHPDLPATADALA
ncbi:MAG: hypothetical protein JWP76_2811, partial [Dactylosporangium sp.]|nr:hypothetical protein [Dactylosporangium sp.]